MENNSVISNLNNTYSSDIVTSLKYIYPSFKAI